jgi:hypothetical protein
MAIVLGPVLKFCGIDKGQWVVSVLLVRAGELPSFAATADGTALAVEHATLLERPVKGSPHSVDRFVLRVPQGAHDTVCQYQVGGIRQTFTAPASDAPPTCAYTSCNGFSDPKKIKTYGDRKNAMWQRLRENHQQRPYHLLLMGGDQLYTDAMWSGRLLKTWACKPNSSKLANKPVSNALLTEIDDFFFQNYLEAWSQAGVSEVLASVPTVMMWDDHDIIDGWGSYGKEYQESPVFKAIYARASYYFLLFQQHSTDAAAIPLRLPQQDAFSFGMRVGDYAILALDLRSERSPSQVMSAASWDAAYAWMAQQQGCRHLLLMSSIPVVHPDFSTLEMLLCALPGRQELEDDLQDHWLSRTHQWERLRLIHRLQEWSQQQGCRVTILSGDVHVAAIGAIESEHLQFEGRPVTIHQLTSSGVVHPPPPAMALFYLEHVGDKVEQLEGGIRTAMYKFPGTAHRYIGARNYLSLEPDRDLDGRARGRLWANWWVENEDQPYRQAILPL